MEASAEVLVKETKRKITTKRIEIQDEKAKVGKMGEETDAVLPPDLIEMYCGKMCVANIKNGVRSNNMISGFERQYPSMDDSTKGQLKELHQQFMDDFDTSKKRIIKILEKDTLWLRVKGIKGFTAYQLALIKSYMKNPDRFETPSKLMIYAGIGCVNDPVTGQGFAVTKANINRIKEIYSKQGKEFNGFNTELSGRMTVIVDCLLRGTGFFYQTYNQIRSRLAEKAINEGKAEYIKTETKAGKILEGYFIKGKNNQSLDSFADKGARRRVARILLHIIWKEWRELKGLPIRHPYAIEKLAHTTEISLAQIIKADKEVVKRPRKKKEEEKK